jgi:hypothetical protein
VTPAAPQTTHTTHTHMNTTLQLPESAAEAINQLQARKEGLRALLPKGSFPFEERHEADCRSVRAGMGSGSGFINHAINEIDETISEIIKRCLIDRNW